MASVLLKSRGDLYVVKAHDCPGLDGARLLTPGGIGEPVKSLALGYPRPDSVVFRMSGNVRTNLVLRDGKPHPRP